MYKINRTAYMIIHNFSSHEHKLTFQAVSGRFATKLFRFKSCQVVSIQKKSKSESIRYTYSVDSLHIRPKHKCRLATETYKIFLDTNLVMINTVKASDFLEDKLRSRSVQTKIVTIL